MSDHPDDLASVTRRLLIIGASTAGLRTGVWPTQDRVVELASNWLAAEERVDRLYLRWARLEAVLIGGKRSAPCPPHAAASIRAKLTTLDREIETVDDQRQSLLTTLEATPCESPRAALGKLAVAVARLGGEGGPEHLLVSDAVSFLANAKCVKCGANLH
jgi:hypothetical protein